MGDLLAAMPGLAAHQVALPAPELPRFDGGRLYDAFCTAMAEVSGAYPDAEALPWLRENRPDIILTLQGATAAVDAAFAAEDAAEVARTTDHLRRLYLRAWQVYAERPPIIEVQSEMFMGCN